jgi:predicted dehydrogenase
MRVAIVGVSGHLGYVLSGVRGDADARLVGVAPGSEGEDIAAFMPAFGAAGLPPPPVFPDYREMLDEVRPDVVAVAPHFGDIARVAAESLDRGMHVFAEKPLATTLDDLARIEASAAASRGALGCMLALRYDPAFYAGWQAVRAGAVGAVRLMAAQKSYKLGTRPPFYGRRGSYGGTIPWVGSHGVDLLLWFGGAAFRSVYAVHSERGNRGNGDLEVSAFCQFAMADEIIATVSIDYLRPASAPTHGDDRIRVAGTEGVLEVRDGKALLIGPDGVRELPPGPPAAIFGDFLQQARGRGTGRLTAGEAIAVTRACLLARESADTGRVITF